MASSSSLSFLGRDMAVDLGTANTLVYVRGRGVVLNEPSVVAVHRDTGAMVAVGTDAKRMIGRTPANIVAIRPLKDGVIADFETTERMLRYFIQKVHSRRHLAKPRLVICVPSGITGVERRAVKDAGYQAGARQVLHHRGADGGRDRRRPAGRRADRQHGRRHRRRHHRGGGHLAGRHRDQQSIRIGGDELDTADHRVREEGVLADARRAHRRGDQDADRLGVPEPGRAARRDPGPRPRQPACPRRSW